MPINKIKFILLPLLWCLVIYGFLSVSGELLGSSVNIEFSVLQLLLPAAGFMLLFTLSIWVRSLRWWSMIRTQVDAPLTKCSLYFAWVFLIKMFTPLRAGEFLRVIWIQRYGGNAAFITGTVLAERVLDLAALMLIILACAVFVDLSGLGEGSMQLAGLMLLLLALILVVLLVLNKVLGSMGKNTQLAPLTKKIVDIASQVLLAFRVCASKSQMLPVIVTSLLGWLLVAAAYQAVLSALVPDLPLYSGAVVVLAVNLIGFVSGAPGNIGSYEFAGVLVLTTLYAVDANDALVTVIVLHVLQISGALLAGLASRLIMRKEFHSVFSLY